LYEKYLQSDENKLKWAFLAALTNRATIKDRGNKKTTGLHQTSKLEDLIISLPTHKKKGRPLHSITRVLIGGMEILFLKLAATIFGLH
jgi:hypothetical protein